MKRKEDDHDYSFVACALRVGDCGATYLFRFQKSREGRDARGRGIQNEAVKFMYQVLYIGNIVLIIGYLPETKVAKRLEEEYSTSIL